MNKACFRVALLTTVIYVAITPTADAQQVAAPADGEIIVTAQKRSESLQKAAIAVHALQPADLEKSGIRNALDLQYIDPAVKVVPSIQPNIAIRGLGTANFNPGVDPSVAFNQDGIYLSTPNALTPVLFDIERVEAVLGPQGTLYGRNSNGGTINFITSRPTFELGGYVRAGAGNYGAINSEGALNLPLSDTVALRVAGGSDHHDAYNDNGTNDVRSFAGRAKLLFAPGDLFTALLTVDAASRKSHATSYDGSCPPDLDNVPACAATPYRPWSGLLPSQPIGHGNTTIYGASAEFNYDLGWADLISLTGYKVTDWRNSTTAGWYGGVDNFDFIQNTKDKFFTQEIRLSGAPGSPFGWVLGGYYSHLKQTALTQSNYVQNTFAPDDFYQAFPLTDSTAKSAALFADLTLPVPWLDGFSLVGGLRYTHETKSAEGLVEAGTISTGTAFPGTLATSGKTSLDRLTWKAGFKYQATPNNLLFFTASTGFKSGGINVLPPEAASLITYAPELITAYEIGSKNMFFNNRLQLNASLFRYDYKNYQAYVFWRPGAGAPSTILNGTFFPIVNSQSATFKGGEFSARWRPSRNNNLGISLNLLDNKFDDFLLELPYSAPVDFSHTPVFLSPRSTIRIDYERGVDLANGDRLAAGADVSFVSHQIAQGSYANAAGDTLLYRVPSYHKTNANLSYTVRKMDLTISAFIRNIENKAVVNSVASGFPIPENYFQVNYRLDAPRTYGFSLRKSF
ncbi:TonB-dependent receptor [Sphingomonas bisphenolicum]|uniref:TonB-dependent receptor n=1 Tax=Sphingomonas bisphenolicum TaxID=296544 RepID=A0ABM7G9K2_9SPHN|nr:TonB-dependent receptor [Sphingomonas bisphenolicum]